MKRLPLISLLAAIAITGCASTDSLTKDQREARRAGWRAAGLSLLNFGLNAAAHSLNDDQGFAK